MEKKAMEANEKTPTQPADKSTAVVQTNKGELRVEFEQRRGGEIVKHEFTLDGKKISKKQAEDLRPA